MRNFEKLIDSDILKKGIDNTRVTKPSYKTELGIMTSQTALKFFFFLIFRVSNSMWKTL